MHLQHLNTTTTNTTSLFLSFFLDDLFSFCTFLVSHPLPFAYLLFFSPHILSLLSFLSPLLLSTTLLLLLTFSTPPPPPPPPHHHHHHALDEKPTLHPPKFLGKTCAIALQLLNKIEFARDGIEDPTGLVEHLHWIVLSPSHHDAPTPTPTTLCFGESSSSIQVQEKGATTHSLEESKDAKLISSCNEHVEESKGSDGIAENASNCSIRRRALHTRAASEGVQREGSMRKEREWKRTLACMLYEERITFKLHNDERSPVDVEGGEEMDLLWEAYEVINTSKINNGSKKDEHRTKLKLKPKAKAEAKAEVEEEEAEDEEEDEEEEEEEEGSVRQLCCLKALKLSAGNMKLGVGRPNLMKISKVLKGMRMFQHFGKHSNSRKK